MKKRDTILYEVNEIINKEYNSNFSFNVLSRAERTWLYTICKVLDIRLKNLKKEFEKELDDKVIF